MNKIDKSEKWARIWWGSDGNDVGWGWVLHDSKEDEEVESGTLGESYPHGDARIDNLRHFTREKLCEIFQKEIPDWCEDYQIEIDRA